jgi:Mrp family chromosome partitioning ATPase
MFAAATAEMLGLSDNRYVRPWLDRIGPAISTASDEQLQEMSEPETAAQALSRFERSRRTMEIFRSNLDVRRVGVSYAIDISFGFQNPVMAADVANAVAEAFIREQLESKTRAAREGAAWLEYRLKQLRTQMNEATQAAQEFRAKHDYGFGRMAGSTEATGGEQGPEAGASEDQPTLEELEVTADTYRKIYESFLQAFTSSVSQQSYPVADARIITPATAPLGPSSPKSKLVQVFGLLAGAMVGIGLAFIRHMLDRTLRWPQQVRQELGLELLGELPVKMGRRGRSVGDELERLTGSRFSESLRRVKTAISLVHGNRPVRTLGFASSTPYEGRSSSVSSLATLYAMSGLRTLVIEADPSYFSATKSSWRAAGPALVQEEAKPITARIVRSGSGWFDIFPNSAVEANELLIPDRMRLLLDQLQSYDVIVVDLPSLTSGAERLAISSLLDATVLVVKWGQTPVDLVAELSRALRASRATTIGVLLTGVRIMSTRRYPSQHRPRQRGFRRKRSVWRGLKVLVQTVFGPMKVDRAS